MAGRIALLRGINVAGKNKVPMAELRELAGELGFDNPRTYIQSGNLLFESNEDAPELETLLHEGLAARFGLTIPVIVRSASRWLELAQTNPFPDSEPKFVHYAASKLPPADDGLQRLEGYAKAGERLELLPDGLWIDYASGVGRSKITPAVLDRCVGSSVTARNWKSVSAIAAMLSESS